LRKRGKRNEEVFFLSSAKISQERIGKMSVG
jgi:hypothetical protein